MEKRTLVVVEDDDFLRSLIAESLENLGFNVTTAANAADARRILKSVDPDAVVLDIDLGRGPTGFDIAENLRKKSPGVGIIFLTSLPDPRFVDRTFKDIDKNEAYLNKHLINDLKILKNAIESVLTENNLQNYQHHKIEDHRFAALTKTQIQLLKLISEGKTNKEIARIRKRSIAATEASIGRLFESMEIEISDNINRRVIATRIFLEVTRPNDLKTR